MNSRNPENFKNGKYSFRIGIKRQYDIVHTIYPYIHNYITSTRDWVGGTHRNNILMSGHVYAVIYCVKLFAKPKFHV